MNKGGLEIDPRGLIFESFRIEGISAEECRTIFLDWALGVPETADMAGCLSRLIEHYGDDNPGHPMTAILHDATQQAAAPVRRRRRRRGR